VQQVAVDTSLSRGILLYPNLDTNVEATENLDELFNFDSRYARSNPVGPPPTIKTGTSSNATREEPRFVPFVLFVPFDACAPFTASVANSLAWVGEGTWTAPLGSHSFVSVVRLGIV
jgi:hypothetical protein